MVAFARAHDLDAAAVVSNTVEIEWPPRSGRKLVVPEVDEARWFDLDDATRYILPSQTPLLNSLSATLIQLPRAGV